MGVARSQRRCPLCVPWVPGPSPSNTGARGHASTLLSHPPAQEAPDVTGFGRAEPWVSEQKERSRKDSCLRWPWLRLQHLGRCPTPNRSSAHMSRMRKVSDFKWNLTSVKCVIETATGMGGSADRIGSLERKEGVGCQFPGGRTALLCFF